jgi:hypothetical protein
MVDAQVRFVQLTKRDQTKRRKAKTVAMGLATVGVEAIVS